MTTQATQSNNAPGRRSLPSTFFAPIQSARRYMERQRGESGEDAARDGRPPESFRTVVEDLPPAPMQAAAGGVVAAPVPDWAAATSEIGGAAAEAVLAAIARLKARERSEEPQDATRASTAAAQEQTSPGFAAVARQVWREELESGQESPVVAAAHARSDRKSVSPASGFADDGGLADDAVRQTVHKDMRNQPPATIARGRSQPFPQASEAQGLAHDANNLLSALRLYSELLCFSGVLHERHRHYAEDLKLLSARSQDLIERLLRLADSVGTADTMIPEDVTAEDGTAEDMAKPYACSVGAGLRYSPCMTTGTTEPAEPAEWLEAAEFGSGEPVSLTETVIRLRGVLGTIAHGALELSVAEHDLPVGVDAEALERILVNLVSNAAKAVRGGGAVRLRASLLEGPPAAQAVLTVDDSGCGMSDAQLAAARGEESARLEQANRGRHGVGLSIVRQLVAISGGEFFAYSRPGTGTRIEIRWRMQAATLSDIQDAEAHPGPLLVANHRSVAAPRESTGPCPDPLHRHASVVTGAEGAIAC